MNHDYVEINNITAVNKVHRLIRRLNTLSVKALNPEDRQMCKNLLDLDQHKIIEEIERIYPHIYSIVKCMPVQPKPIREEKSGIQEYMEVNAYKQAAHYARERIHLQVQEWHKNKQVMIFETLTFNEEHVALPFETKKEFLKEYLDGLRRYGTPYCLVSEKGNKTGRPHFHVLYRRHPAMGIRSHGIWKCGTTHVQRVRYLGDRYSNPQECILNGWTLDSVVGYMVKYISKSIEEKDDIPFRTRFSRGFGLCQMRKKLKSKRTTNQLLQEMILSGLKNYLMVLRDEVQKEWCRRNQPKKSDLLRKTESVFGASMKHALKTSVPVIGDIKMQLVRENFEGFEEFKAI